MGRAIGLISVSGAYLSCVISLAVLILLCLPRERLLLCSIYSRSRSNQRFSPDQGRAGQAEENEGERQLHVLRWPTASLCVYTYCFLGNRTGSGALLAALAAIAHECTQLIELAVQSARARPVSRPQRTTGSAQLAARPMSRHCLSCAFLRELIRLVVPLVFGVRWHV